MVAMGTTNRFFSFFGWAKGQRPQGDPAPVGGSVASHNDACLRSVMDGLPVMVAAFDAASGRLLFVNRMMRDTVFGTSENPVGLDAGAFLAPEDLERFNAELRGGGDVNGAELRIVRHDGSLFWGRVATRRLAVEDRPAMLAAITDVTAQRLAHEALLKAKERAESTTRIKSQILETISDQIRSPLNGIVGMTDMLLDSGLEPRQRHFGQNIRAATDSLLSAITLISDYSKTEDDEPGLGECLVNPRDVVEEVAAAIAPRLKDKPVDLLVCLDPEVDGIFRGDPSRLRQILLHLAGNAVKFTERGRITVAVSASAQGGLLFRIEDTGTGVAPEDLAPLFERLSRNDPSATRRHGEAGLGLVIARNLVERMGGEIGFESEPDRGAVFWFQLPLTMIEAAPLPTVPGLEGARVLVVDANATETDLVADELRRNGAIVQTAVTARDAIALIRRAADEKRAFAAAVIDYDLPVMSGADLLVLIEADPRLRGLRRILLARGDLKRRDTAAWMRTDITLTKPLRANDVARAVVGGDEIAVRSAVPALADPLRLLLIEDDPINQDVAVGMLTAMGHVVNVAGDAGAGVAMAAQGGYDAVLMDVGLPDDDGLQATARIRALPGAPGQVPVIAMTAKAMSGDREMCLEAGMTDYIAKPVLRAELAAALERCQAKGAPA